MIFRRCQPIVLEGPASTPADDKTTHGHAAFEATHYLEAWHAYKAAFQLDPTPSRAARAALAAPCAVRMSAAIHDLSRWLVLKREDARSCGDHEESWNDLESIISSYEANARRSEEAMAAQRTEIDRLEQQVAALKETVRRTAPRDRKR